MRSVRRVCSVLVAATLLVGVSGCGGDDSPAPSTSAPGLTPSPTTSQDGQQTPEPPSTTVVVTTTSPSPMASIPGTFRTRTILSLDEATGDQRQRVADAMWDFHDGRFTFDSTDVIARLYPLVGTYSVSGTRVSFRAEGSSSAGTGTSTTARVEGTMDLVAAEVSFLWESNAFAAAVPNGQPMGGGSVSAVQGEVRVETGVKIPPHYTGPRPGSYPVTLDGTVNGVGFRRSGTVHVAESAGGNPVDVCLISGFPLGAPEVGAVQFLSNTVCDPNSGSTFDMGRVAVSGATITVKADPMTASTGMSLFTAASSIVACPYTVQSGSMKVTIADGRARGSIDVSSASCGGGRLQATLG
ncbi:hypothetical protein [Micromonospora carbonacea]|uniref:hypothetical protein n=1 Tax=Micromonospora carbonacea TaxID=47853 RepID=UPI003D758731